MNYAAFKDAIKTALGGDGDRMGAEAIIDGYIRSAAINLQKIPAFRSIVRTPVTFEDVIDHGNASLCPGATRLLQRVWLIDSENAEEPSLCNRINLERSKWVDRFDMIEGRVPEESYCFCQSPNFREVYVHPKLVEGKQLIYETSDIVRDFDDDTELALPHEALVAAENYVRSEIAYKLDKNIQEGDRYLILYRRSITLLHSDFSN